MNQAAPALTIADHLARKPRILVVSDVLLYRAGICASLAEAGHLDVVGDGAALEAPALAEALCVDGIVLDVSLSTSLALAHELRRRRPGVRIVGLGIGGGEEGILSCAEAGLAGFVGKDGTMEDLVNAIDYAFRGELFCTPRVAAILFNRVGSLSRNGGAPSTVPGEGLTRRELEIAALVKEGLSNKEIAAELDIGPSTVKNHVHNVLEKLNIHRRSAIASRLNGRAE